VNYIRNSVKAVVNAYTGAVTLYQWGDGDPVRGAWENAFPGVILMFRSLGGLSVPVSLMAEGVMGVGWVLRRG
jgi:uncharacterized membrane protein (UPF0182 family)